MLRNIREYTYHGSTLIAHSVLLNHCSLFDVFRYFRRVWFGRHRLDENSPLLTPAARQRVKLNDGYWPKDMNNYQSIKSAIHFRHLLVCIKGVSNANAASVYAQKVYDLVDVNVGYRFVPMNFHTGAYH